MYGHTAVKFNDDANTTYDMLLERLADMINRVRMALI